MLMGSLLSDSVEQKTLSNKGPVSGNSALSPVSEIHILGDIESGDGPVLQEVQPEKSCPR